MRGSKQTMLAMWDRYGIWIAVYVALILFHGPKNHGYLNGGEVLFYSLFLPLNLTLSLATLCRMALGKSRSRLLWGELISRWLARWILYTLSLCLVGFTFLGSWLTPGETPSLLPVSLIVAAGIVYQHIRQDVANVRRITTV